MRTRELPPPLPPEQRTVGQLIGETIRAYGQRFWQALLLGLPLAAASQLSLGRGPGAQTLILFAFTPLVAAAFLRACSLVHGVRPTATAFACAVLVFAPVPFLIRFFVLPGVAWLALFGLSVPAAMVERLGFRRALERGRQLALADFVHSVGSLAALVIVVVLSELTLISLLRSQGNNGQRVAHALADLVMSPLLYVGGALLYVDQAARVVGSGRRAAVHPPLDADPAGHHDAQVEP
ncbi:MAG: hypothetical protein ACJ76I_16085 [Gaiellaceae bacterium]